MDNRIRLDDPMIPFLEVMPKYWVGQRVIDDGFNAVWSFAESQAESAALTRWQEEVANLLITVYCLDAVVDAGDSPGSDSYIRVGIGPVTPTEWEITPGVMYQGVEQAWVGCWTGGDTEKGGADYARHCVQSFDASGDPTTASDQVWCVTNDAEELARFIHLQVLNAAALMNLPA